MAAVWVKTWRLTGRVSQSAAGEEKAFGHITLFITYKVKDIA